MWQTIHMNVESSSATSQEHRCGLHKSAYSIALSSQQCSTNCCPEINKSTKQGINRSGTPQRKANFSTRKWLQLPYLLIVTTTVRDCKLCPGWAHTADEYDIFGRSPVVAVGGRGKRTEANDWLMQSCTLVLCTNLTNELWHCIRSIVLKQNTILFEVLKQTADRTRSRYEL